MRLLLDTHVVLWWLTDDAALSDDLKTGLDEDPDVYVSAASIWEVAIKQSIGKLTGPGDLTKEILSCGFRPLAITVEHAAAAGRLPHIHRDPFDRILIAQARTDQLTLVTHDPSILQYDVDLLPV